MEKLLNLNGEVLEINLPQGKTQSELLDSLEGEFKGLEKKLYGLNIKLYGRITTAMALYLGHKLAHICASVSIFDPKLNSYILVIKH